MTWQVALYLAVVFMLVILARFLCRDSR